MRTLESLGDLRSQTVVVRCDLNVPLKEGVITDDGRIRASLTTIRELREAGHINYEIADNHKAIYRKL